MDPVQCKGYFVLDALCFAEVNSCLHSQNEKTTVCPSPLCENLILKADECMKTPSSGNTVLDINSCWPSLSVASYFWLEIIRFVIPSAFFICDAMDQMADEMTLRGDVKDKVRVSTAEESSAWVRGGEFF